MVLYKLFVFPSSPIFNMDMPEPVICSDWLKFQRSPSLKLMNWLNPNCKWMIIGKSFTKFVFYVDRKSKMATTLQDILLTQDYMGKYRNILLSKTTELIEPKLYMDVHWMVLYKITVFRSSLIYKISTWPPGQIMCSDWLKFQSSSSLKLMNWLNPNCTWMIIGRSFTKLLVFFYVNLKSKMAAYAGHSFNTVPYWKI
jgi:hypothetical protein